MTTTEYSDGFTELLGSPERETTEPARSKKRAKRAKGEPGAADAAPRGFLTAPRGTRPSTGSAVLAIGGEPRVDLLPPEVKARRAARRTRGRLGVALAGVAVVALLGVGAAYWYAGLEAGSFTTEQSRQLQLVVQQGKFAELRRVQSETALAQAAQQVGAATEIDWKGYLDKVQATLPSGVVIQSVDVDSSTPLAAYGQPTIPLQGARVATITFTALSSTLPSVPEWLVALQKLPGYSDGVPDSVTYSDTDHNYTSTVTIHVDAAVFDKRFSKDK